MSEWRQTTIDRLGRIVTGKTPPSTCEDCFGGDVPFITPSDMDGRRLISNTARYLTREGVAMVANARIPTQAILVSCIGSDMGKAAIAGRESVTNQQINAVIVETDDCPLYIYYELSTRKSEIRGSASGSAQPILNKSAFGRLPISLPSPAEQCAIAHILGTLDDKIELNRRMNETLEAMARAIFQSWFVDFDPVRAKASGEPAESICQRLGLTPELLALFPDSFEDLELGEIPTGWRYNTLAVEAKRYGGFIQTGPFGSQLHAADYVDEGVPVVMPQDLVNRRVSVAHIVRVTDEMAERLSRHALKPGDVVYSRRGDVERHALVSEREAGWLCGTGCLLVRPGEAWPSQAYLSEALDLPVTREWLVRHAVGATMPNLNTSILGDVPLLIPSEALMHAFEDVAGPLRQQQIASSVESDSLTEVRDVLLPKLLSGEIVLDELGLMGE